MNRPVKLELEMPFFKVRYQITVYEKEDASGMDFILLKMVELSHQVKADDAPLGLMMDMFSVGRELLPLVTKTFRKLVELKLVKTPFNIDEYTDLKRFEITENGERVLEDHILGEKEKVLEKSIYCFPGRTVRCDADSPLKMTERPGKIKFDRGYDDECAEFIRANPELLGIRKGEVVSTFPLDSPRSNIYMQDLELLFDTETGRFTVSEDCGVDAGFIKTRYSGDALVDRIPENVFRFKGTDAEARNWSSAVPEGVLDYRLPFDLNLGKGQVFCRRGVFSETPAGFTDMPSDSDCDIMVVESEFRGHKYWLTESREVLEGLVSEHPVRMLAYRSMSKNEIAMTQKI